MDVDGYKLVQLANELLRVASRENRTHQSVSTETALTAARQHWDEVRKEYALKYAIFRKGEVVCCNSKYGGQYLGEVVAIFAHTQHICYRIKVSETKSGPELGIIYAFETELVKVLDK